jgi:hypothetical protein
MREAAFLGKDRTQPSGSSPSPRSRFAAAKAWLQEVPSLPRCQLEPASGPGGRSSRSVTRERTLPFQAPVLLLPALTTLVQCLLLRSSCPECRTARTDQPLPGDDGMVLGAASLANFILRAFCRLAPLFGLSELMKSTSARFGGIGRRFPWPLFLILRPTGVLHVSLFGQLADPSRTTGDRGYRQRRRFSLVNPHRIRRRARCGLRASSPKAGKTEVHCRLLTLDSGRDNRLPEREPRSHGGKVNPFSRTARPPPGLGSWATQTAGP